MKKLTLTLLSIAMGLLLGNYYSLIPRKLLVGIYTVCIPDLSDL